MPHDVSCAFLFPDVGRIISSALFCTDPNSADRRHGAGDVLMLLQKTLGGNVWWLWNSAQAVFHLAARRRRERFMVFFLLLLIC